LLARAVDQALLRPRSRFAEKKGGVQLKNEHAGDKDLLDISPDALKEQGIRTRIINPRRFIEEVS